MSNNFDNLLHISLESIIQTIVNNKPVLIIFIISEVIVASFLLFISNNKKNIYHSEQVELTPKIKVPKPVGQGQYGTGWWLNKKDYEKVFACNEIDRNDDYQDVSFSSGGIITNFERKGGKDRVYYIKDNIHTLLVGSSGSGKSRSIIIPTITMLGLAGENIFISDVKGELYLYTAEKLKQLGYNVIALDYINFLKKKYDRNIDILIVDANDGKNVLPFAKCGFNIVCYEENKILLNGGVYNNLKTAGLKKRISDYLISDNVLIKQFNYYETKEIKKFDFLYVDSSLSLEKNNKISLKKKVRKLMSNVREGGYLYIYYDLVLDESEEYNNSYFHLGEMQKIFDLEDWKIEYICERNAINYCNYIYNSNRKVGYILANKKRNRRVHKCHYSIEINNKIEF